MPWVSGNKVELWWLIYRLARLVFYADDVSFPGCGLVWRVNTLPTPNVLSPKQNTKLSHMGYNAPMFRLA